MLQALKQTMTVTGDGRAILLVSGQCTPTRKDTYLVSKLKSEWKEGEPPAYWVPFELDAVQKECDKLGLYIPANLKTKVRRTKEVIVKGNRRTTTEVVDELAKPYSPAYWPTESLDALLSGKYKQTPLEFYQDNLDFVAKYIEPSANHVHPVMALHRIQCFTKECMRTTGIPHFNGLPGSGKSTCLEVLAAGVHNPKLFSKGSTASISTAIALAGANIFIDEAEDVGTSRSDNESRQLLRDISRANSCQITAIGREADERSRYTTAAFANVSGNDRDPALRSRTIPVNCVKSSKKLPRFDIRREGPTTETLLGNGYSFLFTYAEELVEIYNSVEELEGLSNRDFDNWIGFYSIGALVRRHSPESRLDEQVVTMARTIIERAEKMAIFTDSNVKIAAALCHYVGQRALKRVKFPDRIFVADFAKYLKRTEGLSIADNKIGGILVSMQVAKEGGRSRMYVSETEYSDDMGTYVLLEPEKLKQVKDELGIKAFVKEGELERFIHKLNDTDYNLFEIAATTVLSTDSPDEAKLKIAIEKALEDIREEGLKKLVEAASLLDQDAGSGQVPDEALKDFADASGS